MEEKGGDVRAAMDVYSRATQIFPSDTGEERIHSQKKRGQWRGMDGSK